MQRLVPILLVILMLAAAVRSASPIAALDDGAVEACGTVQAYASSTATTDGRIAIGTRSYVLAADDLYRQQAARNNTFVVGRSTCLTGVSAGGRVTQHSAIGFPEQLCGTVLAFTPAGATAPGSVTFRDLGLVTLAIPPATDMGVAPVVGSRACFTIALDAQGDGIASGRVLTIIERTTAQVSVCGTVKEWTVPVPAGVADATEGRITVGTHHLVIAVGTGYSSVNAAPVVGQPTCLSGAIDGAGRLIQYAAQPGLVACVGGPVASLVRPIGGAAGSVRFALAGTIPYTADSGTFVIPAGTALPANAENGTFCFTLGIGGDGNAIATGARPASLGSLPNTSTR